MRFAAAAAAAVVLAAVALAGCGSVGDRQQAASAVALHLFRAIDGRNGADACATLAPETVAELEGSAGQPCAEAILDEDLPKAGQVTESHVYGQWAQVQLTDDTVFLAVFKNGWRVVAAGCRPRGEKPYDCKLPGG